jgi:hypothetical protein
MISVEVVLRPSIQELRLLRLGVFLLPCFSRPPKQSLSILCVFAVHISAIWLLKHNIWYALVA